MLALSLSRLSAVRGQRSGQQAPSRRKPTAQPVQDARCSRTASARPLRRPRIVRRAEPRREQAETEITMPGQHLSDGTPEPSGHHQKEQEHRPSIGTVGLDLLVTSRAGSANSARNRPTTGRRRPGRPTTLPAERLRPPLRCGHFRRSARRRLRPRRTPGRDRPGRRRAASDPTSGWPSPIAPSAQITPDRDCCTPGHQQGADQQATSRPSTPEASSSARPDSSSALVRRTTVSNAISATIRPARTPTRQAVTPPMEVTVMGPVSARNDGLAEMDTASRVRSASAG